MNSHQTPLVSVVISFLNEERFLAEAVESVIRQQYSNWKLILVDDGSSDNSSKIAKNYTNQYPNKIIYAEHQGHVNKGLSASRNYGISWARGELIAVLDADDVWLPMKLQVQVTLMNANPKAAMLCEACEYWYSWHDKTKQDVIIQIGKLRDRLFDPPALAEMLYPLSNGAAPSLSGMIIRKSVFEKHGGFEEQFTGKYQLYEDQAFLHKIYLNEPIYISSLCHHKYRQREGSLVQKVTSEGDYHVVRRFFLEWLQQYIQQNDIKNPAIHKLVRKAFRPYHYPIIYKIFNGVLFRWKLLMNEHT